MSASIDLPTRFDAAAAGRWVEEWNRVADLDGLSIGLGSDAFVSPAGVALLAAGIADRVERGLATSLKHPGDGGAFRYLQRIDFFRSLGVELEEEFVRRGEEGRFVPLRRIEDLRTARELADLAASVLEVQAPETSPSLLRMARFVFEELGANVVQHSGRPGTGFGLAQSFPQSRRFQLAFADAGMGFLASLKRNPEWEGRVESEAEALQFCMSKRVTGAVEGRRNMGWGLFQLTTFADELGGDLWIASGDALIRRRGPTSSERTNLLGPFPKLKGCWICLDAPLI